MAAELIDVKRKSLVSRFADRFGFDASRVLPTLKATAFKVKGGEATDEQMMALLIVAEQYGLNPFTREIFAFPDKQNGIVPVVSVDGWSRIINEHPNMNGLKFIASSEIVEMPSAKPCSASITCVIYRKDRDHPTEVEEYLDEVYRPPFKGTGNNGSYEVAGPWQSHTKRMLRHKALIQCARLAFGFVGIYDEDEAKRIIEGEVVQESQPSGARAKLLSKVHDASHPIDDQSINDQKANNNHADEHAIHDDAPPIDQADDGGPTVGDLISRIKVASPYDYDSILADINNCPASERKALRKLLDDRLKGAKPQ